MATVAAKDNLPANVFCAWCQRELAVHGEGLSFTLCADCLPLVKAEFDARIIAAREKGRRKRPQPHRPTPSPDVAGEGEM